MGDLKKPWSVYRPVLTCAVMLYLTVFVFELTPLQVVFWMIALAIMMCAIVFLWDVTYPAWFAKKINPYMLAYQQDHNSDAYFDGISQWKKYAITRVCKNALMVNHASILYEESRLQECLDLLAAYRKKTNGIEEKRYIYNVSILCLQKANDSFRTEEAKKELQVFERKYGIKKKPDEKPAQATAYQSKQAMLHWLVATLLFFICFIAAVLLDLYSGLLIFFLFFGAANLLISLLWLVRWLVVGAKERRHDYFTSDNATKM